MPETMREIMMRVMTHIGFGVTNIHDQDDHEGDDISEDGCEDDGEEMMKFTTHLGFLHVPHSKLAHHFLRSLNSNDC